MTVDRLNAAFNYIEAHLTEKIDLDILAGIVGYSRYDFQRMFMFFSDMSVADYIRKRRMTLAGIDIKHFDMSVIDAAVKYGYESPVSFARAFKAFHGITPSEVKKLKKALRVFPRVIFQITMKEVEQCMRKDKITVKGKEYEASYFGEMDMSTWSEVYQKREFWRLENAYEDFKKCPRLSNVLPYNNYPPIDIEVGQVFVVDYYRKKDGSVERAYYVSDGKVWQDMPSTTKVALEYLKPFRVDKIRVGGKEYEAEYFGGVDISEWSKPYTEREFRRLKGAYDELIKYPIDGDVLPYNNYPPIDIEVGQAFVIDYHSKEDGSVERMYYLADGTIWQDMPCTRRYLVNE